MAPSMLARLTRLRFVVVTLFWVGLTPLRDELEASGLSASGRDPGDPSPGVWPSQAISAYRRVPSAPTTTALSLRSGSACHAISGSPK